MHVEAGDPLFKLITSENWQLVFEINDELKKILADDSVVKVRFKSDETTEDDDIDEEVAWYNA